MNHLRFYHPIKYQIVTGLDYKLKGHHLRCKIRNYNHIVIRCKTGFKYCSKGTTMGKKYRFNRHLNSAIPYKAKYIQGMIVNKRRVSS